MATEVTSINELNTNDVKEQQDILSTFLAETYPSIDISHGVFRDLVQYINAIFAAKEQTELDRLKSARSLLAITEDPDLADEDSVDNILSNYNITRNNGTYAVGVVLLEFKSDVSLIIPSGVSFRFNDLTFTTTTSYMVLNSTNTSSVVADRILTQLSNGNYGCTINVTATQIGTASCLKKGTELTTDDIYGLSTAIVYNDFYGGTDAETNYELITRLKSGIATKCWGNRVNIEALLRNNETLASMVDVSVIGMNDEEMLRDQMTLFPISLGGKVDIYVKTAPTTYTESQSIYATLTASDLEYDYWTLIVPGTILPGFWRVVGIDYLNETPKNDIVTLVEQSVISDTDTLSQQDASFTVHQSMQVSFKTIRDPSLEQNANKPFNVTVMGLPSIDYVQDICNDRSIMPVSSDVLIKAAVPCITTVSMVIKQSKNNTVSESTVATIKNIIASSINNKGFTGYLTVSELTDAIQGLLGSSQNVASVQLSGVVLGPAGTMYRDVSNKQLVIPDMPLSGITARTTTFFSDVSYVDIILETVDEN